MSNLIAYAKEKELILLNPGFDKYDYAKYFEAFDNNALCRYPLIASNPLLLKWRRMVVFAAFRFICHFPVISRFFISDKIIYARKGLLPQSLAKYILLGTADKANLNNEKGQFTVLLRDSKYIFIGGWMLRHNPGFDKASEELKILFTPKEYYLQRINALITSNRQNIDLLIGVHVRRGDYKDHFGGIYYYDTDVYRQRMLELKKMFPEKKIKFLVCSNEKLNAAQFKDMDVVFGSGEQIEDMYSFAFCDFLIGPPSTFTAWASFWGKVPLQFIMDPHEKPEPDAFRIFDSNEFSKLDSIFFP
jgi:hypothetical protein